MEIRRPTRPPRFDPGALPATLRHHRWSRPLLAVLLVAICLSTVRSAQQRSEIAAAAWTPHLDAWVTTGELAAGHRLAEGDVVRRPLPAGALPRDATVDSPVGRHLADAVGEGEILRDGRLGDPAATANSSLVGPGRGAVGLPTPSPHLQVGDRVDLYALFTGARVGADAEVLSVVDGLAVVAVADEYVPSVIGALSVGELVPVLVG
ncbi:MAG: hypothetical protein RIB98_04045 [Acidimicrobiales bacterium]